MNAATSNSTDAANPNIGTQALGGFGYGIGLSLGFLIIFVLITYASYMCKRLHDGAAAGPAPNRHTFPSRSSTDHGSATNRDFSDVNINDQHINGLDEATLSSYPKFTYTQLKTHKISDSAASCSICLADYKDTDLLKLLPDCGHLFHLNCIDPWLILHATCPVCRKSPVPTPLAAAASDHT